LSIRHRADTHTSLTNGRTLRELNAKYRRQHMILNIFF
jgi:hypothetical protein